MPKVPLTFNTQNVNISVVLKALSSYRCGEYQLAMVALTEILDVEPQNWDARLMLGACNYKLGNYFGAQRAFSFICDLCPNAEVRSRAQEGLLAVNRKVKGRIDVPPEFGSCATFQEVRVAWLD